MYGMTFNGVRKEYLVTLRGKRRPPWAPLERDLIQIPGMVGAYHSGNRVQPRRLNIPVLIETKNLNELQKIKEDMASWLLTDGPKELIFDDEPDRTYFAMLDGEHGIDEIIRVGVGMLNFVCPDPYKYGGNYNLTPKVTDLSQPLVIPNVGTVSTPPTFEIELKDKTTHLDIVGNEEYMRLGKPVNEEEYAVSPEVRILWDEMASFNDWSDHTAEHLDKGVMAGSMATNGYSFYPSSLGTGTYEGWHGPVKIKTLPETLTDFRIDVMLGLKTYNNPKICGRVEIYLLDENKNVTGKLSIRDYSEAVNSNYVELRAGDKFDNHYLVDEPGDTPTAWTEFDGLLRLSRSGNKWSAYATKFYDGGKHGTRRNREWIDIENKFTRNVKYIVIHFAGFKNFPMATMHIGDIKVWKINPLAGSEIPYIGDDGDVFTVDMKRKSILKNGEPFTNKDFGARFFDLKPGDNAYVVGPEDAIDNVGVEWRVRYK